MSDIREWDTETWKRELYAQMRGIQADAVRAAMSPSDYTLRVEEQSREALMGWIEMYATRHAPLAAAPLPPPPPPGPPNPYEEFMPQRKWPWSRETK